MKNIKDAQKILWYININKIIKNILNGEITRENK